MEQTVLFFLNSVLFGIGLSMDAFSVSVANSLRENGMKRSKMLLVAGVFGGFQFLMPVIGYFIVHTMIGLFLGIRPFIPWAALVLLLFIGVKMLIEGIRHKTSGAPVSGLGFGALIVQGIATSIDALSVGLTNAEYAPYEAIAEALIIGAVTFLLCMGGLFIGRKAGKRFESISSIIGGVILIAIGVEIFVKNLFF